MKKITYIFSGFSIDEHFGKEVNKDFKNNLKECKNIVFIPGGMDKNDKIVKYVNTDIEWFKEIGIEIKNVDILDIDSDNKTIEEQLKNADIIFLMGGDTIKQHEFIQKLNISDKIKNFPRVVIGVSAGAINLGKISVCSKDIEDGVEKTMIYEGIGRVNYTFEPHFDIDNVKLLNQELYPISEKLKIYGVTNNTALSIYDEKINIIKGDLFIVNNAKVTKII